MDFSEADIAGAVFNSLSEFYASTTFSVIKFAIGIYALVLLANIILLLVQRGLSGDLRDTILGMNIPPELATKKDLLRKKWESIRAKIETGNESQYKVAIIEADNLIDDLISRMGYAGDNFGERLTGINPGQIENIEELRQAHEFRNRIIHEADLPVGKEKAEEILAVYAEFLHYFEVL